MFTTTHRLENKSVLVTGAGVGTGLAIVKRLSMEGATVVAADQSEQHLTAARNAAENCGAKFYSIPGDVMSREYCDGLHALTGAIAVDHGKDGIRCNAIAPGWIDTDLNNAFIESMGDPVQFKLKIDNIHPTGRTGMPQEVAILVCWLASDEAGFVTGQVYTIDSGRMAKLSLPE